MSMSALFGLAAAVSGVSGLTVWPAPQVQTDSGVMYTLDATNFRFDGAGAGATSDVLLDGFKRYRGIVFMHSSLSHTATGKNSVITSAMVNVSSANESLTLETDQSYALVVAAPTINFFLLLEQPGHESLRVDHSSVHTVMTKLYKCTIVR